MRLHSAEKAIMPAALRIKTAGTYLVVHLPSCTPDKQQKPLTGNNLTGEASKEQKQCVRKENSKGRQTK